jgi:hypothetical protein
VDEEMKMQEHILASYKLNQFLQKKVEWTITINIARLTIKNQDAGLKHIFTAGYIVMLQEVRSVAKHGSLLALERASMRKSIIVSIYKHVRENVRKECGLLMSQITEASLISRMITDILCH